MHNICHTWLAFFRLFTSELLTEEYITVRNFDKNVGVLSELFTLGGTIARVDLHQLHKEIALKESIQQGYSSLHNKTLLLSCFPSDKN